MDGTESHGVLRRMENMVQGNGYEARHLSLLPYRGGMARARFHRSAEAKTVQKLFIILASYHWSTLIILCGKKYSLLQ